MKSQVKIFMNTHYRTLDTKGRFILPPQYREVLIAHAKSASESDSDEDNEAGFWLTAYYGRLVAYLPEKWDIIVKQMCKIPFTNVKLSHFKSKVLGLATYLFPDSQGRVRIPQPLIREAGLIKELVLVSVQDQFEIWDQQRFDAISTDEDMSEALAQTGLEINL